MIKRVVPFLPFFLMIVLPGIAAAQDHLFLVSGNPPSQLEIKSWGVDVSGYSPDGWLVVADVYPGSTLLQNHPQLIDLGEWEQGKPRLIIPAKKLTAAIHPLFVRPSWVLVDNFDEVQKERIQAISLQHGRPFLPQAKRSPVPQTKSSRFLPSLSGLLNNITSNELEDWVNTLVAYNTRYSPSLQGHQAAENMAGILGGWGYDVTRWRYIYHDMVDLYRDGDSIWICANSNLFGAIFHSMDGGNFFEEIDLPTEFQSRTNNRIVTSGNNLMLAQTGRLLASSDSGQTWSEVSPELNASYSGLFMNGIEGWCLTTTGKVYHSLDYGFNWTLVFSLPPLYDWYDLGVSGSTLIAGGSAGLYISSNGGLNWTSVWTSQGKAVYRITINSNQVWAVGAGGLVVHSINGFSQYQADTVGERSFNDVAFSGNNGVIGGEGGTLYRTADNGSTWQKVTLSTESRISGLEFSSTGLVLLIGSSGTILESDNTLNSWQSITDRFDPNAKGVWTDVIAEKHGSTRPREIVMVSAHLDSIVWGASYDPWTYAPGADDNGTGSSTVLTLAQAFKDYPTSRTMRFVLFTGEEEGLIGSSRYAFWLQAQDQDVQEVYNLDMTGYAVNPDAISQDLVGDGQSQWLVDYAVSCSNQYVPGYASHRVINPLDTWSDHAYFWFLGIPALCSIESEKVRSENPYYHTPDDIVQHINFEQVLGACRVAGATIGELAQPEGSPLPANLAQLKVFPNPFRPGLGQQVITFENVPVGSKVEIYDLVGNKVKNFDYIDGYKVTWEGRGESGARLATGIYFYSVKAPDGSKKTGKLAIIY